MKHSDDVLYTFRLLTSLLVIHLFVFNIYIFLYNNKTIDYFSKLLYWYCFTIYIYILTSAVNNGWLIDIGLGLAWGDDYQIKFSKIQLIWHHNDL